MLSLISLLALTGVVSHHVAADKVSVSAAAAAPVAPIEAARYIGDSTYSTRFEDTTWNNSAWTLTTTQPQPHDYHAMAFVANGYHGSSMASTGPFIQAFNYTSGWPVFSPRQTFGTIGGFFGRENTNGSNFPWLYQYGTDSVISGIPHWGPMILELDDGSYLDANTSTAELSDIALTQDFKQGLAQWSYTWTPKTANKLSLKIKWTAFADKLYVNRGYVQLQVEPSQDCSATLVNVLDGTNAVRTDFVESGQDGDMIYTAVKPVGVANVTAYVYAGLTGSPKLDMSTASMVKDKPYIGKYNASIAQAVKLSLKAKSTAVIIKHVGIASSDGFTSPQSQAKSAAGDSMAGDFASCLAAHTAEWAEVIPARSVSDFTLPWTGLLPEDPVMIEKQIASVVSTYDLLQNTVGPNALALAGGAKIDSTGISVCGLTSDCYGGQRFWDQDFWMHPLLATSFPLSAKTITNLRVVQYPQAKENVKMSFSSSQNATKFSPDAALYPWTSGRDANCTATGPCFDYVCAPQPDLRNQLS